MQHLELLDYYFYLMRKYHLYGTRLEWLDLRKLLDTEDKTDVRRLCETLYKSNNDWEFKISSKNMNVLTDMFANTPDDSIIIAPGDSPSRLVNLFKMLFAITDDQFKIKNRIKKIRFVSFPISSLKSLYKKKEYDTIKAYILSKTPSDSEYLYILDYHFSDKSFNIFQSIYPNIKKLQTVIGYNPPILAGLLPDAEHMRARCLPKYDPISTNELEKISFVHCNLSTIFMYLLLKDESNIVSNTCVNILSKIYYLCIAWDFDISGIRFIKEVKYKNEIGLDYSERNVILFRYIHGMHIHRDRHDACIHKNNNILIIPYEVFKTNLKLLQTERHAFFELQDVTKINPFFITHIEVVESSSWHDVRESIGIKMH